MLLFSGYNVVVRIPSGATNIDVRQHSYSGKPEDDNYLGKKHKRKLGNRSVLSLLSVLLYCYGSGTMVIRDNIAHCNPAEKKTMF